VSPEDPYVQRIAAESIVSYTGMSIDQAVKALEFQDAAAGVMDELDQALGDVSGGMWFDWSDRGVRL
jgi:hypothetical protein